MDIHTCSTIRILVGLALAVGVAVTLTAPAAFAQSGSGPKPVKAQLLADAAAVEAGKPFEVGVLLKMDEGWHVYWKNPGDAGLATAVEFRLPQGFSVGPLRWPRPITFTQPGDIVGYGYEKEVMLIASVTPPKDLPAGQAVPVSAKVSWLACEKLCVPGEADLSLSLPVTMAPEAANGDLFSSWRQKMPPLAADFALPDQDGKPVNLSDYAGKVVVLEWFNPDCPFVQRHHAQRTTMIDLAAKYVPKGVVWLAVNSTYYMPPETTAEWRTRWKMDYPVLIDRRGKVARAYGAKSTPHMFVIDPAGEIVYEGAIDDDPRGASKSPVNYVDQALTELLADRPIAEPTTKSYGCSVKYPPPSVYDFSMQDIDGRPVDLSRYEGKVLLVVNVASKCGHTPQYAGLEKLYEQHRDGGLVVLGFPANNFGGQEPGTNQQIKEFCTSNYNVTFPMFAKISVKGQDQAPLYAYLTDKRTDPGFGGEIKWNFTKFLIGRDGKIIARFEPTVEPQNEQVLSAVEQALTG